MGFNSAFKGLILKKKKIMFALEQVKKTHRWRRGIALLFL